MLLIIKKLYLLEVNGGRVGKGISAQASHRTVREALTSYGSYYPVVLNLTCGGLNPNFQ